MENPYSPGREAASIQARAAVENGIIFRVLDFRNLTAVDRMFRSNISGRFDPEYGVHTMRRVKVQNWKHTITHYAY